MSSTTTDDFNFKNTKLAHIPVSKIRENSEALRTVVDKESVEYQEGLDSVRKRGVLNPILVRQIVDPATGEELFGLIDGLHRFNWAMDSGLTEIPAQIGSLDEGDLIEAQMIGNMHKIETKAVQYTKALVKVLASNPLLTIVELASRLSRSPSWLTDRLGLLKLTKKIQDLVDNGTLTLTNAYALTKLPPEKQEELLQSAISKTPAEFVPQARNVQTEVNKAKREGRAATTDVFVPAARLQRLVLIKDEQAAATKSPETSTVILNAKANGVTTVEEAIGYALSWALHLDPVSVAADQAKWNAEKAADKAAKEERAAKKEAAKLAAAAGIAAGATG